MLTHPFCLNNWGIALITFVWLFFRKAKHCAPVSFTKAIYINRYLEIKTPRSRALDKVIQLCRVRSREILLLFCLNSRHQLIFKIWPFFSKVSKRIKYGDCMNISDLLYWLSKDLDINRSRPAAYLSTSLKLRTYLNLRTRVLKFKYANFALWPTTKT